MSLRRVSEYIVRTPDPLRAFTVRETDTGDVVQGVHLMVCGFVHRFVQLGDCWDDLRRSGKIEVLWPVVVHSAEKVCEPLAGDIVTDEEKRNKRRG